MQNWPTLQMLVCEQVLVCMLQTSSVQVRPSSQSRASRQPMQPSCASQIRPWHSESSGTCLQPAAAQLSWVQPMLSLHSASPQQMAQPLPLGQQCVPLPQPSNLHVPPSQRGLVWQAAAWQSLAASHSAAFWHSIWSGSQ